MHELADVAVTTMEITVEATVIESLPTMTYDDVRHPRSLESAACRTPLGIPPQSEVCHRQRREARSGKQSRRPRRPRSAEPNRRANLRSHGDSGRRSDLT